MNSKQFTSRTTALDWARKFARDYCHPYHIWRIVPSPRDARLFAVAIISRNTGRIDAYAC